MSEKTLAQRMYEAYWNASGGMSAVTGTPLPEWAECPEKVRECWQASALVGMGWFQHYQSSTKQPINWRKMTGAAMLILLFVWLLALMASVVGWLGAVGVFFAMLGLAVFCVCAFWLLAG